MEHHFVQAGDIRMHYAEAGDPAGEPLVLLHGWPQNHRMWDGVVQRLDGRFRVIAPDLRGFGKTDAPRSSYAKQELADDVLALLDALELDRVRLAGHDWGGYGAFLLALSAPERISALRAFSIVHPWSKAAPKPWHLAILAYQPIFGAPFLGPRLHRTGPAMDLFFKLSSAAPVWNDDERRAYREQWQSAERAEAGSRIYRTWVSRELFARDPQARLTVPTRLVVGRGDQAVHAARLDGYEQHADDMTVELVDGSHWLPDERPDLVADRIAAD